MNTQLLAQQATTNQLVVAALGAADRRDPAQPVGPVAVKPCKDWLPQVKAYAYSGEPDRSPEAFLAQYHLHVQQQNVPASERTRRPIGKLAATAKRLGKSTQGSGPSAPCLLLGCAPDGEPGRDPPA